MRNNGAVQGSALTCRSEFSHVTRCTVTDNAVNGGGATIFVSGFGTLFGGHCYITDSAISGNSGHGVEFNNACNQARIIRSTISDNVGSGVVASGADMSVRPCATRPSATTTLGD